MPVTLVKTARDASHFKHLPAAFHLAEEAVSAGLEDDGAYVSPTKAGSGWIVDVRDEAGEVLGYLRRGAA